jgi:hypothetical protein
MHHLLDSLTDTILRTGSPSGAMDPAALMFLLRRYAATGRDDVRVALEQGLTAALDTGLGGDVPSLPEWIRMFAEAATVSEDERITDAIVAGVSALRRTWPSRGSIAGAMWTIDACLAAARVPAIDARESTAAAIDELERIVCSVYTPGERIAHSLSRPEDPDGDLDDHVASAGSLLTAYAVTGRLPYSMLAEELTEAARPLMASGPFAARCEGVRVMCRLAALHADESYRAAAVVAPERDYLGDARRLVDALGASGVDAADAVGIYALAVDDLVCAS